MFYTLKSTAVASSVEFMTTFFKRMFSNVLKMLSCGCIKDFVLLLIFQCYLIRNVCHYKHRKKLESIRNVYDTASLNLSES